MSRTACEADGSATVTDVPVGLYKSMSFRSGAPFEVREGETARVIAEPAGD
ncbi:MAG: hypothetical protein IT459_06625 [Planctomycetes bacterium]|nr:hypothetical protein [Planctomycetota bacterium]